MILVTVRYNQTFYPVRIFYKVSEIGDNAVYSRHFLIGKCHSAIDQKHIVPTFIQCDVFADLIKSAERHYPQRHRRAALSARLLCRTFGSAFSRALRARNTRRTVGLCAVSALLRSARG